MSSVGRMSMALTEKRDMLEGMAAVGVGVMAPAGWCLTMDGNEKKGGSRGLRVEALP